MARLVARLVVLALLSAGVTAAAPNRAHAQSEVAKEALKLFEKGRTSYNLGNFDKAIDLWKQGYEVKPDPIFLFNIAQAFRQKQDYRQAIFFYKSYLREKPDAANRADVEQRIAELQKLVDAQMRESEAPPKGVGEPSETTTPEATEPEPAPEATEPEPEPEPKATEPEPEPEPPPTRREEPLPRPGRGLEIAGIATGGVGVVLLSVGILFSLKASALEGELEDAVAGGTPWGPELEDKRSQGESAALMGQLGVGLGVAAIATGGTLFYLGLRKDAAARDERRAGLEVVPTWGGLCVRGSF